ncbi:glycine cleavage system H protein, mitochondrial [Neodiprion fabricii]|uniref:glycine cleavage system H protein, mitochondrial n=1 Tax=Neodiprion fabricii TaxID=2872261 RepID=UPI001ED920E8|nr:glycine cleavage system H protein, mitochondrial [Neodiprion fabricii]XP_046413061.1 glycine cleavage system H protein, mitochondrial [Neodiprion fabricii]
MAQYVTQILRCTVKTIASTHGKQMFNSGVSLRSKIFLSRGISTTRCMSSTERWYTDKHEWVEINGKVGTIGISHYAQDALGDVVYAQLPDVGSSISQEDECGALESVKAASELYSPVSGKVVEKNEAVESSPGLINSSCYEKGWLFKVELTNPDEIKKLMDEKTYDQFLKTDSH